MIKKFGIVALFSVLTLLLTACPSTSTPPPAPTPDFSIAVSNAAPSIAEGATENVTVTITPTNGFSDQVALTINNSADVTATFNPASTATTSVLTLGSAKAGSYPMTVTATAGTITKTAGVTLTVTGSTAPPPPTKVTISGIVIDEEGIPFPNIPVIIMGQDPASGALATMAITTVTNAAGEFTLNNVEKPYNIAAIENNDEDAVVYMGLTTENPVLAFINEDSTLDNKRATLIGDTDSLPAPQANHRYNVVFGSPDTFEPQEINDTKLNNGNFRENNVDWPGPTNTTAGTVHVLQGTTDGSSFTGYGSGAATLTDGVTTTIPSISLTDIGESNAGGKVTFPSDYTFDSVNMSIIYDANTRFSFANDNSPSQTGNFSFVAPQVPGGQLGVSIFTDGPDSRRSDIYKAGQTINDINMNFEVLRAPSLALPADDAPNVTTATNFSWAAAGFSDSVYVVEFDGRSGATSSRNYFIVTKDLSITIPDFSAQGLGIIAGNSGDVNRWDWEVVAVGPVASMDDAATPGFIKLHEGTVVNSDMAKSESQIFDFFVNVP